MPYPAEHSCRLTDPKKYDEWGSQDKEHNGKPYRVIRGKLKGKDEWEDQGYRYNKDTWTESEARDHCTAHKGIKFEPAKKEEKSASLAASASQIVSKLNATSWAIRPEKLEAIREFAELKINSGAITLEAQTRQTDQSGTFMTIDEYGIAIIDVFGVIGRRLSMEDQWYGGISTELLVDDVNRAAADSKVKAILLRIGSPGGMVDGTKELADLIYMARDRKPIFALAEGEMCSGAYWIGSSAHKIFAEKTAIVGSIGVISAHYDLSGLDERLGIKCTYIYSGKYKGIANDAEPLTEEGKSYLKDIVDDFYGIFVEDIERNRTMLSLEDIFLMESKVYIADKALSQGLIDGIGTYPQIYHQLKREAGIMNKDELKAQFPDLFNEVLAEGFSSVPDEEIKRARPELMQSLKSKGAAEERTRVMAVFTEAYGKETGEKFSAIVKPGATVADMMAFAQDKAKADILAKMVESAPESVGQEAGAGEGDLAGLEGEDLYKAEYAKDPDLKKEYGSFDAYAAYKKAEAEGRIRVLRQKQ